VTARLQNQWPGGIIAWLGSGVLDMVLPILPEKIEAQAVSLEIDLVKKTPAELSPLSSVDEALKYRVLHSLAVILTTRRYPAQAPAAFHGFRTYIIGHDYQGHDSPREEGRVCAQVLAYRPCKQNCLDKRQ
jgi:hypothetical protein